MRACNCSVVKQKNTNDLKLRAEWSAWQEYELLDSGRRKKLERFGSYIISRSEPKAWWERRLDEEEWRRAVADYDEMKGWTLHKAVPSEWRVRFDKLLFLLKFTQNSKHVGIFPEQSPHWEWIRERTKLVSHRPLTLLNLFGYTGAASLVAASAGFSVTHVDASRSALSWARKNQELSRLGNAPIRWILDDALGFVKREARRGQRYDAILLDPPSFGRGPQKEIWKTEKSVMDLLSTCRDILSDNPLFIVVTMYALDASPFSIRNVLSDMMKDKEGHIEVGELVLRQSNADVVLPRSLFGRWENDPSEKFNVKSEKCR